MCRSIKVLRKQQPPATTQDVAAASLQFVRKVSGFRKPSKANQMAFDSAVEDVSAIISQLLRSMNEELPPPAPPDVKKHLETLTPPQQ